MFFLSFFASFQTVSALHALGITCVVSSFNNWASEWISIVKLSYETTWVTSECASNLGYELQHLFVAIKRAS